MSNPALKTIVNLIKRAPKIALFHHIHPDGDSISCSYGLAQALKIRFPDKEVVVVGNLPYLQANFGYLNFDPTLFVTQIDASYLAIIGDTAGLARIELSAEYQKTTTQICFDHHRNSIDFTPTVFWQESEWIASTMQAILIAKALEVKFDETSAFYLCIGLLTDSNHFTYSLADPQPPLLYAEMVSYISHERMDNYFRGARQKQASDLKIIIAVAKKVKLYEHLNYVVLNRHFLAKYGREKVKAKIHLLGNVKGYPIWVMVMADVENPSSGRWEVHIRSNGPAVNELAIKYGGGGHKRAAGCKVQSLREWHQIRAELDALAAAFLASPSAL